MPSARSAIPPSARRWLDAISTPILTTGTGRKAPAPVVSHANDACARLTGWPVKTLIGQPLEMLGGQSPDEEFKRLIKRLRAGDKAGRGKVIIHRRDGRALPIRFHLTPAPTEPGMPGQTIVALEPAPGEASRDPGTKAAPLAAEPDRQIRGPNAEALLAQLVQNALEAIVVCDASYHIIDFNFGAERMFGYARDELIGQPIDLLLPEAKRERHRRLMTEFVTGPDTARRMAARQPIEARRKSGAIVPCQASIMKIDNGKGSIVAAILVDLTERVALEQDLRAARVQAEMAHAAKTRFLNMVSHELLTPLNAVLGFTELMQKEIYGPIGDPRYLEYLADVHQSGGNLLKLVNELLDLSRVDLGALPVHPQSFQCGDLLRDVVASFRETSESVGVPIILEEVANVSVVTDPRLCRQIVSILLGNAVKFSNQGGSVVVGASHEGERVVLRVQDQGIGIPPDRLSQVVEPFVQVDDGLDRRKEGAGLGLSLAQKFAEALGGTLSIKSELGAGTSVTVSIPAALAILQG